MLTTSRQTTGYTIPAKLSPRNAPSGGACPCLLTRLTANKGGLWPVLYSAEQTDARR